MLSAAELAKRCCAIRSIPARDECGAGIPRFARMTGLTALTRPSRNCRSTRPISWLLPRRSSAPAFGITFSSLPAMC